MRRSLLGWFLALVCLVSLTAAAHADKAPVRVSVQEARKIALARVPGTIVHEKQKKKKGKMVWNIKVRPRGEKGDVVKKIVIDANTGEVVKIKDVKAKDAKKDKDTE